MSENNCPDCKKAEESGTVVTHVHFDPATGETEGFGYLETPKDENHETDS